MITKASTDLDVALTLINSVNGDAYIMAKYHLEEMEKLTLAHTKERLKLVKQRIKDDLISNEIVNRAKTSPKEKEIRECYHCKKKEHLKTKCFKWLATDEDKKFTEEQKAKKTNRTTPDTKSINPKAGKKGRKKSDRPALSARKAVENDDFDINEVFMTIETPINFARG